MSKGKRTERAQWIKDYLGSIGVSTSNWEVYRREYNFYAARIKKLGPESYEEFLQTCTFPKQKNKPCGIPKVPEEKPFDTKKWWKSQKKEWLDWRQRMANYRADKIRNQEQTKMSEAARMRDFPPYSFKLAMKCLGGRYPIECFPQELEGYKEELQELLDKQKKESKWINSQ